MARSRRARALPGRRSRSMLPRASVSERKMIPLQVGLPTFGGIGRMCMGVEARRIADPGCGGRPGSILLEQRVREDRESSHGGRDRDLERFARLSRTTVERPEVMVPAHCGDGRHIEDVACRDASAADRLPASEHSGIPIHRCKARKGRNLRRTGCTEFLRLDKEGDGGNRADARRRCQDTEAPRDPGIGLHKFRKHLIEISAVPFAQLDPPGDLRPDPRRRTLLPAVAPASCAPRRPDGAPASSRRSAP